MWELSPLAALYSADPKLTFTDLKKGNINDQADTSKIIKYAQEHQIRAVTQQEAHYPNRLKNQTSAPFVLYYQGDLSLLDQSLLWIVWPRNPSEYAGQVMQSFFLQAYKYQLATISGFAKGVDQTAHQLSLKYQMPTIAVLGWGFAHYLRGKDRDLLAQILANGGLVISQFKIWFEPTKWSFPARNKLIAQLCDMLFLPEAQEKSGSLITTEFAYQYKKPVYSVPAPIFSQQSAWIFSKMEEKKLTLISDFSACLAQYFLLKGAPQSFADASKVQRWSDLPAGLSEVQIQLCKLLQSWWEMGIEELMSNVSLEYAWLMQELTFLEMEGLVEQRRPGIYAFV